jgi:hypothetical protein
MTPRASVDKRKERPTMPTSPSLIKDPSRMMTVTKNAGEELDEEFKEPSAHFGLPTTLSKEPPAKEEKKMSIPFFSIIK